MQRTRVLLDASCLSDGRGAAGIGRYAAEIAAALAERGDLDIETAVPAHPPRSDSRPGRFLHAHPELLRRAHHFRPHVVHGLGGEPVLGIPFHRQVVTVHDVEMWREPPISGARGVALRAYSAALLRLYRRCAAIIAVSRTTAEEGIVTLRLDSSRVHVVPHGVSAHFSSDSDGDDKRTLAALGLNDRYLLWSGSLRYHDPRKGLDVLLQAVAQLDRPIALALAGATGAESERISAEASRLGVRARLCGSLSDTRLAALYRGAIALVMPSFHEGFGLPVLEAMASGTPVVATTAGNLPDLAERIALLVPPRDAGALAAAIQRVIDRKPGAARPEEGVRRASEYSWPRAADLTADVYRRVARAG